MGLTSIPGYDLDKDEWYTRPLREGETLPNYFYRGFTLDGVVYLHHPDFDPSPPDDDRPVSDRNAAS